jgi:hypothetical protein
MDCNKLIKLSVLLVLLSIIISFLSLPVDNKKLINKKKYTTPPVSKNFNLTENFENKINENKINENKINENKINENKINKINENKNHSNETCKFTKEDAIKSIKDDKKKAEEKIKSCNSCDSKSNNNSCKSCSNLLPVLDPMFNMREMCKQIILLEDHLFQKEKRCHDCICKHFLTIEALAEEAITLDKTSKYPELVNLPQKIRTITKKYISNHKDPKQPALTGQDLRVLRKNFMLKCFEYF